jgi:hypothetical protein
LYASFLAPCQITKSFDLGFFYYSIERLRDGHG